MAFSNVIILATNSVTSPVPCCFPSSIHSSSIHDRENIQFKNWPTFPHLDNNVVVSVMTVYDNNH